MPKCEQFSIQKIKSKRTSLNKTNKLKRKKMLFPLNQTEPFGIKYSIINHLKEIQKLVFKRTPNLFIIE